MYKCKDCNLEYIQKPNYCDCGNNLFEEIENIPNKALECKDFTYSDTENKKNFSERYPYLINYFKKFDILSVSIFSICIILSILSWIFIGKENPDTKLAKKDNSTNRSQLKKNKSIPSIDSFWDNKAPIVEKKEEPVQEITIPQPELKLNEPQPVPYQKEQPYRVQEKKVVKPQPIQKPRVNNNAAEMSAYKARIRHALFSHLAVTSVQGEGKCEIEFSLDKSGRLLNRKFSKLSDNKSLNDAVYTMLMSVPQYSPPPQGYNGEKIRISFYFNNGYYEVSY